MYIILNFNILILVSFAFHFEFHSPVLIQPKLQKRRKWVNLYNSNCQNVWLTSTKNTYFSNGPCLVMKGMFKIYPIQSMLLSGASHIPLRPHKNNDLFSVRLTNILQVRRADFSFYLKKNISWAFITTHLRSFHTHQMSHMFITMLDSCRGQNKTVYHNKWQEWSYIFGIYHLILLHFIIFTNTYPSIIWELFNADIEDWTE